jgi:GR25 family glycosyltransferase involved in LPS biosynthesis
MTKKKLDGWNKRIWNKRIWNKYIWNKRIWNKYIWHIWLFILLIAVGLIQYFFYKRREIEGFDNTMKYLNGIDIIYWINLDRSKDRRISMENMFGDKVFENIPQQRISAYDGKKNPKSVYNKLVIDRRKQSNTEYACLLSHLETIQKFDASQHNVALILEDDATLEFKKYWKKSIKEIINNAPADWDIIMVSYMYSGNHNVLLYDWSTSNQEYDKYKYENYYSTIAYLINKNGARKILSVYNKDDKKYKLSEQYKAIADIYLFQALNTYVYKYPMFIYKTDNDSTIHDNHLPDHITSKQRLVYNYTHHYDQK